MKIDLVVTRHKALVNYLNKVGLINGNTKVKEHVTESDVKDKVVAGVLPHRLSCLCGYYVEVSLTALSSIPAQQSYYCETCKVYLQEKDVVDIDTPGIREHVKIRRVADGSLVSEKCGPVTLVIRSMLRRLGFD